MAEADIAAVEALVRGYYRALERGEPLTGIYAAADEAGTPVVKVGSGVGEFFAGAAHVSRAVAEVTASFAHNRLDSRGPLRVRCAGDVAWFSDEVWWSGETAGRAFGSSTRWTGVCLRTARGWKLVQLHVSEGVDESVSEAAAADATPAPPEKRVPHNAAGAVPITAERTGAIRHSPFAIRPSAADRFTNPDELFDVLDGTGRPLGRTKRRADVHRDGDWHRAFHCWVLDESGAVPALIFQRRGARKDTWPGRLDASVGGHYGAGEALRDVVREVEEEIGRAVRLEDLVRLGVRVCVNEQEPGTADREIQDVFLWRSTLPFEAYRPQPVEVTSLERATVADLLKLFGGAVAHVPARALLPGGETRETTISLGDFVPALDGYFYRLVVVADLTSKGYPHLVV